LSHPTPLHPDADLALVLDEMRQSVAECGDEGLIMRVFVVGIRLALLSILDTLIGLLADFRAGRLPPLLPALSELSTAPSGPSANGSAIIAAQPETPSLRFAASRHTRALRNPSADAASGAPGETAAPSGARSSALASRSPGVSLSARGRPIRDPDHDPCGIRFYPSHVPRPPAAAFGFAIAQLTHALFVAISKQTAIAGPLNAASLKISGARTRRWPGRAVCPAARRPYLPRACVTRRSGKLSRRPYAVTEARGCGSRKCRARSALPSVGGACYRTPPRRTHPTRGRASLVRAHSSVGRAADS
jgi:hypothetical protein